MGNSAVTPFSLWHRAGQRLKSIAALIRGGGRPLLTHLPYSPSVGMLGAVVAGAHLVMPALICWWWTIYSHPLAQVFCFQSRIEPLAYCVPGSHKDFTWLASLLPEGNLIVGETATGWVKTPMGTGAPCESEDPHNLCLERAGLNLRNCFQKLFPW